MQGGAVGEGPDLCGAIRGCKLNIIQYIEEMRSGGWVAAKEI